MRRRISASVPGSRANRGSCEVAKVARRAAERALHAIGEMRIVTVEQAGEHLGHERRLLVQIAVAVSGVGVALLPEPSVKHYGLEPVKLGSALREGARACPSDELYLVTHRALRDVPRVRVVWDLLVESVGDRPRVARAGHPPLQRRPALLRSWILGLRR